MVERRSWWLPVAPDTAFPPLRDRLSVDIAVVGGGIVGLTAALLLKQAGRTVAVLESRRVARQVSGLTTAKITSLHGLIYTGLVRRFGDDVARLYGESNEAALRRIAEIAAARGIDCDFERKEAYTFCIEAQNRARVEAEAETAVRLGLPASFVADPPIRVPNAGAIRFSGQAQFHPYRYLVALARAVDGDGSHVFEETQVVDVREGDPCTVRTRETTVTAHDVIVATNLPFLDRAGFFAKAYPQSHVVLAARIEPASAPDGMFISVEQPTRSVRTHRDDAGVVLVATGAGYKTGQSDPQPLVDDLIGWVQRHFAVQRIERVWTNEDFHTMDGLPFVGRLTGGAKHLWTGTGFAAWGMTGGTLAAMILCDLVCGRANPWADIYDSTRIDAGRSVGTFMRENTNVAGKWIKGRFGQEGPSSPDALAAGEAAVLKAEGRRVAAFRDDAGTLHAVSATCTHMGCVVAWNSVARTWDCPCHGSRFELDGRVMCGPAVAPLEPVELAIPATAASH